MIFFKKYSSIKNFLLRYTILKIGNLHIRIHKIIDCDRTTLYHNHPFNYFSFILKGGYCEKYFKNSEIITKNHKRFSLIFRKSSVYHRIESINGPTITLFFAYGRKSWSTMNTISTNDYGIYKRTINNKEVWAKKENGVWFIGNVDKNIAIGETRHSIHQC